VTSPIESGTGASTRRKSERGRTCRSASMPRRWRGLLRCRNWLSRQVLTCAIQFIKPPAPGNLVRGQDDHSRTVLPTRIGPRNVLRASCTIPGPFCRARAWRRPTSEALDLLDSSDARTRQAGRRMPHTLDSQVRRLSRPGRRQSIDDRDCTFPATSLAAPRQWIDGDTWWQGAHPYGRPASAARRWPPGRAGRWRARG